MSKSKFRAVLFELIIEDDQTTRAVQVASAEGSAEAVAAAMNGFAQDMGIKPQKKPKAKKAKQPKEQPGQVQVGAEDEEIKKMMADPAGRQILGAMFGDGFIDGMDKLVQLKDVFEGQPKKADQS